MSGNNSSLIPSDQFRVVLCKERKRSERSGHPLIVVYLDIAGTHSKRQPVGMVQKNGQTIAAALKKCTRETDCLGWFEEQKVLGIIFVDTAEQSKDLLIERIKTSMDVCAGGAEGTFEIAAQVFPFENNENTGDSISYTFYSNSRNTAFKKIYHSVKRLFDITCGLGGMLFFCLFLSLFHY